MPCSHFFLKVRGVEILKKKISFIVLAIVFIAVIAAAALLYPKLSENYTEQTTAPTAQNSSNETQPSSEAEKATDFTVTDMDGNTVALSDFFGKPIVLNFWATWCGPCQSEMPAFDSMYEKYGDDVVFLMVNQTDGYQDTVESATAFIEESGYSFPIYFDTEFAATYAYGVYSIPRTYLIDENGVLVAQHTGAMSETTLESYIEMIWR